MGLKNARRLVIAEGSLMEETLLTLNSTEHSPAFEFILLLLQILVDVASDFDFLFLVVLDQGLEVGLLALPVLVDLFINGLGQVDLFLVFGLLLNAAGIDGLYRQVVEFALKVSSLLNVIINVEVHSYLNKLHRLLCTFE